MKRKLLGIVEGKLYFLSEEEGRENKWENQKAAGRRRDLKKYYSFNYLG